MEVRIEVISVPDKCSVISADFNYLWRKYWMSEAQHNRMRDVWVRAWADQTIPTKPIVSHLHIGYLGHSGPIEQIKLIAELCDTQWFILCCLDCMPVNHHTAANLIANCNSQYPILSYPSGPPYICNSKAIIDLDIQRNRKDYSDLIKTIHRHSSSIRQRDDMIDHLKLCNGNGIDHIEEFIADNQKFRVEP